MIALASLGLLPLSGTFYGVFESARSILCLSLRITFCSVYALRCCLWTLSFAVVFSIVGNSLTFPLRLRLFLLGPFCIARANASPSGTR